ncbi:MAG: CIA30 family protein [Bacteroidia bacterium]|nr:CIA30 family protein [Bacteroidia bacterium]
MKLYFIFLFCIGLLSSAPILFDFDKNSDMDQWYVVNDGVMGGLSKGKLELNEEGHAEFSGFVSTLNNGGFTSIRLPIESQEVSKDAMLKLTVKGDGNKYQLRIKHEQNNWWSYINYIETSEEWDTYTIPLNQFEPSFRGRKLDFPNFDKAYISEFGILIGNKKNENFSLTIDSVEIIN